LVEHRSPKPGVAGSIPAGPAIFRNETDSAMLERFKNYLAETRVEMKKVTWPTKNELKDATRVVVVTSILLTVFIGVVDQILSGIIKLVFK
jgi:preprotein translocase subunit SecE